MISGWKIGGTGSGCYGILFMHHENCGVLSAGRWTQVSSIGISRWSSSLRIESVNPTIACLAAQYADCSGIER
jgi:hypothetical protein